MQVASSQGSGWPAGLHQSISHSTDPNRVLSTLTAGPLDLRNVL